MGTPLTNPIAKQATQYEVVAVLLNFQNSTVEFRVALLDANGAVMELISMASGVTELGFTTVELNAVRTKVANFLKLRNVLN